MLCFDEFTVTDIADAMILGRLFTALFAHGVVVVATSNVEPDRLYEGGLNRTLFLPFIALLQERMEVVQPRRAHRFPPREARRQPGLLHAGGRALARGPRPAPSSSLTGRAHGKPMTLTVKGHPVEVPQAAGGVARFSFADLCSKPLGAADYLGDRRATSTRSSSRTSRDDLRAAQRGQALHHPHRRALRAHVKLLASAEAEAHELYQADTGREAFEFDRTVSRLIEMRSEEYLSLPHGRPDSAGLGQHDRASSRHEAARRRRGARLLDASLRPMPGFSTIAADQLKRIRRRRHVTVVGIADAAGMTHANVYRYFSSKAALIDAVAGQWLSGMEATIADIADAPDPADDKLERLIQAWARAHRDLLRRTGISSTSIAPRPRPRVPSSASTGRACAS